MCLVTLEKRPTYVKKDMIVYKAVSSYNALREVNSLIQNFTYTESILYKTKMKTKEKIPAEWSAPRSYDSKADEDLFEYLTRKNMPLSTEVRIIAEGFHSAESEERLDSCCIRKFLIPKGSYIYKDCSGLIVSNQIQLLPED